jgi:hypothetical protein
MTVVLAKVHWLTGYVRSGGAHQTMCGRFGWEEDASDEFTDAECRRFEATEKREKVTCRNCLRAAGIRT